MQIIRSVLAWFTGIFILVVFFPLTLIIWLGVLPFDPERRIIHRILMWQSTLAIYLMPVWKVHISGREKGLKDQVYVIISNHQSILDILIINCLRYRFKWISKIENTKVPFLGWYLRMADYVTVDRGNEESKAEMLARSYRFLKKGVSLMIFPEGTRSLDGQPGFFKRGAFQLAIEAKVPILPIVIDGTGSILAKHSFIFKSKNSIFLKVLDPVLPGSFGTDNPDILSLKFSKLITSELSNLRSK
jgi:1-acyl-sn-glycerol-3-phosphate acyltransferase